MNVISRFCLIFLTLGFSSAKGSIEKKPLMPASEQATTLFSERSPAEIGVTFVNPIDEKHGLKRLYISGFAAGGVSLGDFDRDGLVDVLLTSGARASRIYRQVSP